MSRTGTTVRSKRLSSQAAVARSWERAAKASSSSRETPSSVAMMSAEMPWGMKSAEKEVSGSMAMAPPSELMGTRDMDSTPPAMTRSSQPERILPAARLRAVRPEAQ